MIGLLLLKHIYGLSDEGVCERWVHDPYFQFFTGEEFFQHAFPHERSDLSHWRKRLGDKLELLLAESLRVAHEASALRGQDLKDSEDAALLAGDEDATGILRIVAAVPLVDIGPLDRTAGERLGAIDDVPQCVSIIRIVGHCARVQHEQAAGSPAVVTGLAPAKMWAI
jgi:hypothetical protein